MFFSFCLLLVWYLLLECMRKTGGAISDANDGATVGNTANISERALQLDSLKEAVKVSQDWLKEAVKNGQQLASQHPYMFWGMVGLLVVTLIGWWLGDKHPIAAVVLVGAVFVLMSVLWLYNAKDIHEMLLATASAVIVVLVGISVEIKHSFEQRLGGALKELQTQLSQQFEARIASQFEIHLREVNKQLNAVHYQLERFSDPILADLEVKHRIAEASGSHLRSNGAEVIEAAERELIDHLEKKRRESGL
jgi:Flp pilus assembly protein TadB